MSDGEQHRDPLEGATAPEHDADPAEPDEQRLVRSLLRGTLSEEPEAPPDLLGGVQKKLRQRSGGKFYADGWSTTREEPLVFYLYTSVILLAVVVFLYLALSTSAGVPVDVVNEPAPVQLVPPSR